MDPERHAQRSARRWGGEPSDFYPVHAFMDTTKELCSDNRHRLLHNAWGIRRVALPIFGPTLTCGRGHDDTGRGRVRTKDVLEQDHVMADFMGMYLPTLADFTAAIASEPGELARFEDIRAPFRSESEIERLLLSPYAVTGHEQSLLITHNTWFLNEVLPRLSARAPRGIVRGVPPSELFSRMEFQLWMDNGAVAPPSAPVAISTPSLDSEETP